MGELVGGKVQGPGYSVEFDAEENEARRQAFAFPCRQGNAQFLASEIDCLQAVGALGGVRRAHHYEVVQVVRDVRYPSLANNPF